MSAFKIDGKEYEARRDDLRAVIDNIGPQVVREKYSLNPERTKFDLYAKVCFDRTNDDSHPWFQDGTKERVLPYNERFEMYPEGTNDTHIKTMMKRALYELMPELKEIDRKRDHDSPSP